MHLQEQVWESGRWCVGVTEPLTADFSSVSQRKSPSPHVRFPSITQARFKAPSHQARNIRNKKSRRVLASLGALWFCCWHTPSMKKTRLLHQKPTQICLFFISHFKKHPHVHTSAPWRHESCEIRHPSQNDEKRFSARVYACLFRSRLRWQCYQMWDSQWVILMTPTPPPSRR